MGYLNDYYSVSGARREEILKALAVTLVVAVVGGGVLYFLFKNYFEERRVSSFLATLQEENYPAAYRFWGCSVEEPCRDYDYENFLEDWGPSSSIGHVNSFRLGRSAEVGTGVIIEVRINGQPQPELWVEKESKIVGFSPYRFRKSPFSSLFLRRRPGLEAQVHAAEFSPWTIAVPSNTTP